MQVPLAQTLLAAGGVKDVGLELGTDGLIAAEGHGEPRGGACLLIAPHGDN